MSVWKKERPADYNKPQNKIDDSMSLEMLVEVIGGAQIYQLVGKRRGEWK